jgi:hypothetical protein
VKPVVKEVEKEIKYDTITKYSYLDEKKFVKYACRKPGSTYLCQGLARCLPRTL